MKAGCGNLKIPGDDLSPWRVMALVAQLKQVVLSNSSRTAQKLILVNEQMRYTQSLQGFCPPISNVWDMFQKLIVHVASRQYSNWNPDNEQLSDNREPNSKIRL